MSDNNFTQNSATCLNLCSIHEVNHWETGIKETIQIPY